MLRSGPRFDDLFDHSISPLSRINTINEGYIAVPDRCVCVCVCIHVYQQRSCFYMQYYNTAPTYAIFQ